MPRLLVHVEGVTEETFVNELLSVYLAPHGYENVSARIIGNARQRSRRGGIRPWTAVKKDIVRHLKEDQQCISTTMVGLLWSAEFGRQSMARSGHSGIASHCRQGADR